jgi:hypothetical protein
MMKNNSRTAAANNEKLSANKNAKVTAQGLREHAIQNAIRIAISPYVVIFRVNVGKVKTADGRYFDTGLPKGYSDLSGVRRSDGRAVFIEVKTPSGRVSPEQKNFIEQMKKCHALAGVARSVEDALKIIQEE